MQTHGEIGTYFPPSITLTSSNFFKLGVVNCGKDLVIQQNLLTRRECSWEKGKVLQKYNDYMAWSRFLLIVLSPFLFLQSIFLKMKSSQKWEVTVGLFIFNNYQISMCIRLVMYEQ